MCQSRLANLLLRFDVKTPKVWAEVLAMRSAYSTIGALGTEYGQAKVGLLQLVYRPERRSSIASNGVKQSPTGASKTAGVQQCRYRHSRHVHPALLTHGELDNVHVAAKPAGAGLEIRRIDEPRKGRRGQRRLRSEAGLRHGAGPQSNAGVLSNPHDPTDLG